MTGLHIYTCIDVVWELFLGLGFDSPLRLYMHLVITRAEDSQASTKVICWMYPCSWGTRPPLIRDWLRQSIAWSWLGLLKIRCCSTVSSSVLFRPLCMLTTTQMAHIRGYKGQWWQRTLTWASSFFYILNSILSFWPLGTAWLVRNRPLTLAEAQKPHGCLRYFCTKPAGKPTMWLCRSGHNCPQTVLGATAWWVTVV